jgi:GT2 family glycosyltransferase
VARVGIVIPTLRRHEVLRRVLDRLERQTGAEGAFEVVVVADAAEPDPQAVERVAEGRPYQVRVLRGDRPGASATRNRGWRALDTALVLFFGDDMLPSPPLVAEHLTWHERNPSPEVAVLGHVRWARELRVTPFMRWLEHGVQFDYPAIHGTEAGWGNLYAANASLKRERLDLVGGFDERFEFGYEELDLARRLSDVGLRVLYNQRAVVEHLHPTTIDAWRDRMRRVAPAERDYVEKHPGEEPYFLRMFERAAALPPARGRRAPLVRLVPKRAPVIGRWIWGSADAYYAQQLAPAFLEAWRAAGERAGTPAA